MIQGVTDCANELAWVEVSGVHHLISGCYDGSMQAWKVVDGDADQLRVSLRWNITSSTFNVMNATIQDVHGLSSMNEKLLKQLGSIGEPIHRFQDPGEKVVAMASVVSRLVSSTNPAGKHAERRIIGAEGIGDINNELEIVETLV